MVLLLHGAGWGGGVSPSSHDVKFVGTKTFFIFLCCDKPNNEIIKTNLLVMKLHGKK